MSPLKIPNLHIYLYQDLTNLQTKQYTSDNGKMEKDVVQENNTGTMDHTITDIGLITWLTEKED